jgi:hypothetical protein
MTTYQLASQADLNTLLTRVTADEAKIAALSTSVAGILTRLGVDEAEIAALVGAVPPAPAPIPPPSSLLFSSDWSAGDILDGGKWTVANDYSGAGIISVVKGAGPQGQNALRFIQHGEKAADINKAAFIPPSTDFWLRFYFRNDDTSQPGDHPVEPGLFADSWNNLIYLRKSSGGSDWQPIIATINTGYPVNFWNLRTRLAHGTWYRFEYGIHFTDPTHVQVHNRISDMSGVLLYGDADWRCSDYGATPNWNGSNTWTLDSFAKAGYSCPVDPTKLLTMSLANNGQAGASDTGLPWYVASFAVSLQGWIGA